ncbi:MAG: response regulator [Deltaproteobacteria bacterium]|nr:response regulator [Deltaproteobacteria bacterium]
MPKVLVLSPSGLVLFRVKKELKTRGFDVVDSDGSDAFPNRIVRAERPDVILVDASANSTTGERLVKCLKEDPTTASTPVLFFSDDTPESRSQVLSSGADGVVPRKDDFDALAETLSLHLKR